MIIGIVGFQGDVSEHSEMLRKLSRKRKINIEVRLIRKRADLEGIDGIIIPGGESTTIYKLLSQYSIYESIKKKIQDGMPVMGTCAGLIILAKDTRDDRVTGMGLLDVVVSRNAYGRQIDSFIDEIEIKGVGKYSAVFIRAPIIEGAGDLEVLSKYRGKPVMVRNNNIIGLTFHPELTDDTRIHEMLVSIIEGEGYVSTGTGKARG